jgi:hypothetical protein
MHHSMYAVAALQLLDSVGKMDLKKYASFIQSCQTSSGGFDSRPKNRDECVMFTGMAHLGLYLIGDDVPVSDAALLAVPLSARGYNQKYASHKTPKAQNVLDKLKKMREIGR